jgi:hypothetical protein
MVRPALDVSSIEIEVSYSVISDLQRRIINGKVKANDGCFTIIVFSSMGYALQ